MDSPVSKPSPELKIADNLVGTQFAQVTAVNAAGPLVTLDFVYVHPRQGGSETLDGNVVARVTMHLADAENLSSTLEKVINEHKAKNTEV